MDEATTKFRDEVLQNFRDMQQFNNANQTQLNELRVIVGRMQGTVESTLPQIAERLSKMNGSVTELFQRMNTAEQKITQVDAKIMTHASTCDFRDAVAKVEDKVDGLKAELDTGSHPGSVAMRQRIEALESDKSEKAGESKLKSKWQKWTMPVLIWLLVIMILLHAVDFLGVLKIPK